MGPYRDRFIQTSGVVGDEPQHRRLWRDLRERFGDIDPGNAWKPLSGNELSACAADSLAVSRNGRHVVVVVDGQLWLVAPTTMVARQVGSVARGFEAIAIDDSGQRIVGVANAQLKVWDLSQPQGSNERLWRLATAPNVEYLSLSADGRYAATSEQSTRATVRIYDLETRDLVYSFAADCDEGMELHPSGRFVLCVADSGYARIVGPRRHECSIKRCAGATFSPDGAWLAGNDLDQSHHLNLYRVARDGDSMDVALDERFPLTFPIDTWHPGLRFSPSGKRLLVEGHDDLAYLVELSPLRCLPLNVSMTSGAAIVEDERRALLGPTSLHITSYETRQVAVVELDEGRMLGTLMGVRGDAQKNLFGMTDVGFCGDLQDPPAPCPGTIDATYVRPQVVRELLSSAAEVSMPRADQLAASELAARAEAWEPFAKELTVDLGSLELVGWNAGLSYLTPELVHRAKLAVRDQPRFGRPLATRRGLSVASAELSALSRHDRDGVFEAMMARLADEEQSGGGKTRTASANNAKPSGRRAPTSPRAARAVERDARSAEPVDGAIEALAASSSASLPAFSAAAASDASAADLLDDENETFEQDIAAPAASRPPSQPMSASLAKLGPVAIAPKRHVVATLVFTVVSLLAMLAGFLWL